MKNFLYLPSFLLSFLSTHNNIDIHPFFPFSLSHLNGRISKFPLQKKNMSNSNRFIRIAQQPPAIVFRGDLFNFFAYFPKQGPYAHQEDVQAHHHHHPRAGQDGFTTYFATINVIPAYDRKLPLSWSSSSSSLLKKGNDEMMIGKSRADFNRENENDRTIRFELGIKCTGTFIVVVRLHRQQMRPPREGGSGGNYIITSVATRKIQVCV